MSRLERERRLALPLRLGLRLAISVLFLPIAAAAQSSWDELDVVDGPNPTLRYGFYTEPDGRVQMGRYYFLDDGTQLRVRLAPYGRTALELPVQRFDRDQGLLELGWEGEPQRSCVLRRQNEQLFLGNCLDSDAVLPMAIRVADRRDKEWMGSFFAVSKTDVEILEKALRIFREQGPRNLSGDRNCDDDIATARFSVFCALFKASLDVAGVYRHRRPAMRVVREALQKRYPGEYAHRLRDINNTATIPDAVFVEVLEAAKTELLAELRGQR